MPVRPLKRWERAGISVAGPAVQIGVSLAVLAADASSTTAYVKGMGLDTA